MKTNKQKLIWNAVGILAGIILVILGGWLKIEDLKSLSGILIGLGAGTAGMFIARIITIWIEFRNPELQRIKNIEVKDERNTIIKEKAGSKTNRIASYVLFVVTFIFVLLDVELYITLTMVSLILLNGIFYVVCFSYYNKRM